MVSGYLPGTRVAPARRRSSSGYSSRRSASIVQNIAPENVGYPPGCNSLYFVGRFEWPVTSMRIDSTTICGVVSLFK